MSLIYKLTELFSSFFDYSEFLVMDTKRGYHYPKNYDFLYILPRIEGPQFPYSSISRLSNMSLDHISLKNH